MATKVYHIYGPPPANHSPGAPATPEATDDKKAMNKPLMVGLAALLIVLINNTGTAA